MNHHPHTTIEPSAADDAYARRIGAQLDAGLARLPYDVGERLRAARMQALAARKRPALQLHSRPAGAAQALGGGSSATLGWGGGAGDWWRALMSALPLIALLVGLVFVHLTQSASSDREIAEIDAQLLSDDLPPAAYTDPGFMQFIKLNHTSR